MATSPFRLSSFEEAVRATPGRKHLLLGNGFSRALRNDIFSYDALFARADFSALSPTAREAFNILNTTDFEVVMRTLRLLAQILPLYSNDAALAAALRADADGLREVLVQAIAQNHPEGPFDVSAEQFGACRSFLAHFDTIYTLNYDLLLYWTVMHTEIEPAVPTDDGFRTPEDQQAEYVTWSVEKTDGQNVFYLHGALHIFDAEYQIQKYTWVNTGIRLIEQIRVALQDNLYPLIVAEGESSEKMKKILHNMYLSRGYRSFAKIRGTLVTYGLSFSSNDDHWFELIAKGNLSSIFVSLFGDPESEANRAIRQKIAGLAARRPQRNPLTVHFFDALSARVWG